MLILGLSNADGKLNTRDLFHSYFIASRLVLGIQVLEILAANSSLGKQNFSKTLLIIYSSYDYEQSVQDFVINNN